MPHPQPRRSDPAPLAQSIAKDLGLEVEYSLGQGKFGVVVLLRDEKQELVVMKKIIASSRWCPSPFSHAVV